MSYRNLTFVLVLMLAVFVAVPAFSEGTIGFNYSQAVDDANYGIRGDYEKDFGLASIDLEGDIHSGDVHAGDLEVGVMFDVGPVGVRLHSSGLLKAYDLDSIGYDSSIGADLVVPIIENTNVSVGIFGRTGNPFAPRTALGTLTDAGFTEDIFEGLGLESVTLSEGISIKPESTLNAAVKAEFDVSRFEIEVKGLFELAGEGEKAHQINTDISTGGSLIEGISWRLSANVVAQFYKEVVAYEIRNYLGVEYPF